MFDRQRHTPLIPDATWHAASSRAFIETYFADAENTFAEQGYWPAHEDDGPVPAANCHHPLYLGLAGICWAQLELAARGYGQVQNDYHDAVLTARSIQQNELRDEMTFENKQDYQHGLLIADLGFMAPLLRLDSEDKWREETLSIISNNLENPVLELLWGSPGSLLMLNALIKSGRTTPEHTALLDRGLTYFEDQLISSPSTGAQLWQQHLYGNQVCMTGAAHGFAGVGLAILKALPFLPASDAELWRQRLRTTTIATATTENGFANWLPAVDEANSKKPNWLVQFCHGAPGVVMCLAELMGVDEQFDALMLSGAALTFDAGPLTKGGNFCHGTAGNGYAFLKVFEQTQDQIWLDRARQFAATAMVQVQQNKLQHNDYHYSLWTGDTGVALFVDACLRNDSSVPTLDVF